ncbi:MAG: YecH family metal-binding protein, partial [Puniceicoccales bacterium]
ATNEIHGHAVLHMMAESGQTYSRESLKTRIEETFGKEARFYICSGGGMTADELIHALAEKGKFTGTPDAFRFSIESMCDH